MKQLFEIISNDNEAVQPVLYLRLGEGHCSFAIADHSSKQLKRLAYYSKTEADSDFITELFSLQPQLNGSFYQVQVGYDYPQNIFFPSAGSRHEDAGELKQLLPVAEKASIVITELLPEWQLYNVYAVPKEVHERVTQKFPAAKFCQQATAALKNSQAASAGYLQVDFRPNEFSLIAINNSKLLLSRTFEYATPDDVIYYLLKTCQQFSLSQNEVRLDLSGLIDQGSALYKELYQYFEKVNFREPVWNMSGTEHPSHFFTSLNDLAKCVS